MAVHGVNTASAVCHAPIVSLPSSVTSWACRLVRTTRQGVTSKQCSCTEKPRPATAPSSSQTCSTCWERCLLRWEPPQESKLASSNHLAASKNRQVQTHHRRCIHRLSVGVLMGAVTRGSAACGLGWAGGAASRVMAGAIRIMHIHKSSIRCVQNQRVLARWITFHVTVASPYP